ncbi:aspartate aminotransferase [Sulfobacillus acidophilus TPY]|uniref:Aminotransferase n=1 Tax=Sulfobacillus acidophilus (strain ATCC 700253 / DSM 10332 / NAL) TaxID=679936 RepID=G8TTW4_SULAD|nr:aspartate aminotransferase [Sulfobacillus acidophilus TPY]AEW04555.1 LL-diaminopimelate aminotransferase apoenzyme [Sulfobacillus acidophilus DSM 10332]
MKMAQRMEKLPPYLFLELDRLIERQRAAGHDVINLGIGDPDQPTPDYIIEALKRAVDNPTNHRYPNYLGSLPFRQAVADWYQSRFGVSLDPVDEVVGLIGSKEGIAHLIWAMAGPGDVVIVPDPSYPVYASQTLLAGAEIYWAPLKAENQFLPDLSQIPEDIARRAKIFWVNYPNNPTGAIAPREFYQELVDFCRRYDILLASDLAYADLGFDGYRAPSVLEIPGAKDIAIEFYSLSKPFNMTGWRIAAAVGNRLAIQALGTMKSNLDSGVFTAVQDAAIEALTHDPTPFFTRQLALYQHRRDMVWTALNEMGLGIPKPLATFYFWFPTPAGMTSSQASQFFVQEANVVVAPGASYGQYGEGWLRISLTCDTDLIATAMTRMKSAMSRIPTRS